MNLHSPGNGLQVSPENEETSDWIGELDSTDPEAGFCPDRFEISTECDSLGAPAIMVLLLNRTVGSGVWFAASKTKGLAVILYLYGVLVTMATFLIWVELQLVFPRQWTSIIKHDIVGGIRRHIIHKLDLPRLTKRRIGIFSMVFRVSMSAVSEALRSWCPWLVVGLAIFGTTALTALTDSNYTLAELANDASIAGALAIRIGMMADGSRRYVANGGLGSSGRSTPSALTRSRWVPFPESIDFSSVRNEQYIGSCNTMTSCAGGWTSLGVFVGQGTQVCTTPRQGMRWFSQKELQFGKNESLFGTALNSGVFVALDTIGTFGTGRFWTGMRWAHFLEEIIKPQAGSPLSYTSFMPFLPGGNAKGLWQPMGTQPRSPRQDSVSTT